MKRNGDTATEEKLERAAKVFRLTRREVQVLFLLAHGETAKSAGDKMQPPITTRTVQTYVDRIHWKVGQANTVAVLFHLLKSEVGKSTSVNLRR
jgi:DNA-binding NarL/FixJ family response regulator